MSEIQQVSIVRIDPNPLRRLERYPYNQSKIEALRQSIADVGLWEGVIARPKGNRVQLAFGHHRIEAARQELGEKSQVPVIIRDLTDQEMVEFMGRENLEDWNSDFLVMLESWEAARDLMQRHERGADAQALDIARLLGWTRPHSDGHTTLKRVAEACNAAAGLIDDGHLDRADLAGLSVEAARNVCQPIVAMHARLEKGASRKGKDRRSVDQAKKDYAAAGKTVARRVRENESIAPRDVRAEVDREAWHTGRKRKESPLLSVIAHRLARQINSMLKDDATVEKLKEIRKSFGVIELEEDFREINNVSFELDALAKRADKWSKRMSDPRKKVVDLREVAGND